MHPIDILHPWVTSWPTLLTTAIAGAALRRLLAYRMRRRRRPAYAWRVIATGIRTVAIVRTAAAIASLFILTSSHLPSPPLPQLDLYP